MAKAMLGKVPLSRWQGLRDDLEIKIAGEDGPQCANDLALLLRKELGWKKKRYDFGADVWDVARARVYDKAGYGRWVNGIFKDSRIAWFANHSFFSTSTHIYDAKTFELFEWSQMTFPAWDTETFVGFCTTVGSDHFGDYVSRPAHSRQWHMLFTLEGKPTLIRNENGRFWFKPFSDKEITIDLPEIESGCIQPIELWRAMHTTLSSVAGKEQLASLVR